MPPSKFRQMVESAKQQLNVEDDTFRPTPCVRTDAMLAEVDNFGRAVLTYRTAVLQYAQHMNGLLQAYPSISCRNLPRVWDTTEPGSLPEPQRHDLSTTHPLRIGGDFDEDRWQHARRVLQKRLNGIISVADKWLVGLDLAKGRNTRLQSVRLQVDSQRRVIHQKLRRLGLHDITQRELPPPSVIGGTEGAVASSERGGGGTSVMGSVAEESSQRRPGTSPSPVSPVTSPQRIFVGIEDQTSTRQGDLARHVMQEQRKLDAVLATYYEQEQQLFEQVRDLAMESARFKSWVAATLLVCKEAFQGVLFSYGPCKLPLPGFSAARSGGDNGVVGPIDSLIQGIPDLPLSEEAQEAGMGIERGAEDTTPAKSAGWGQRQQQVGTPSYSAMPASHENVGTAVPVGEGTEDPTLMAANTATQAAVAAAAAAAAATAAAAAVAGMPEAEGAAGAQGYGGQAYEVQEEGAPGLGVGGQAAEGVEAGEGAEAFYPPASGFEEVDTQQDEVVEEEVVPSGGPRATTA